MLSAVTASLSAAGKLTITGTSGNDNITVRQSNGNISIDNIRISTTSGMKSSISATRVQSIAVNGLEGNDRILLNSESATGGQAISKSATIDGGRGDDVIVGTSVIDVIRGGSGNDQIWGGAGNDTLIGDDGDDELMGDSGNDTLTGGNGADELWGGGGNDLLNGQAGDDKLYGGTGNDQAYGGDGFDKIWGESGNDQLWGGNFADMLYGGDGTDNLYGDAGNDTLYGGYDADSLAGGAGDDVLRGEAGNDSLYGNAGSDVLDGGTGTDSGTIDRADQISYRDGNGNETRVSSRLVYGVRTGGVGFGLTGEPDNEDDPADIPVEVSGAFLADFDPTRIAIRGSGDSESFDYSDIDQNTSPTCSFAAALSAVAMTNFNLSSAIRLVGYNRTTKAFDYSVRLYQAGTNGRFTEKWVNVSYNGSTTSSDLQKADGGEFWTTLFQRGYQSLFGNHTRRNQAAFAMSSITGRAATYSDVDAWSWWGADPMMAALQSGKPVTVGSFEGPATNKVLDDSWYGIIANHAYTVVSIVPVGLDYVVTLRNPWGRDTVGGSSDGCDDGLITIDWEEFLFCFEGYTIGA